VGILERLAGLMVLLLSLAMYGITLCPTVGFIDSGELTAAAWTLGIVHPTGYPLYTLLARLAALVPLGSVAVRVNLLSALAASAASFVLYHAALRLIALVFGRGMGAWLVPSAAAGALCFSWSFTLWSQAVVSEVYSLTALLCALLLWSFLSLAGGIERSLPPTVLICYLAGLSLGNHLSIIALLFPLAAALLFARDLPRPAGGGLLLCACAGALGLTLYLYLPLRAAHQPLLDWGDPRTWERFLWHVSAKQYRVWMFASPPSALLRSVGRFFVLLVRQFHPLPLLAGVGGAVVVGRRARTVGLLLLAVVVANLLYALNYEIPDIEPYYLPTFVVAALLIGVGAAGGVLLLEQAVSRTAWSRTRARAGRLLRLSALLPLILPGLALCANYHLSDMSGNYIAYDLAHNVLVSAGHDGTIVTNDWDIYSPALYIRHVECRWRDVTIIDKELLRRSWYLRSLAQEYPWLAEGARQEIEAYLTYLDQFEHGLLEDPHEIQARFINMINKMLVLDPERHPPSTTFVDGHDRDALMIVPDQAKIPQGIVYRIGSYDSLSQFDMGKLRLRGLLDRSIYKDARTRYNISRYPRLFFERAKVEAQRGDFAGAIDLLEESLRWGENEAGIRLHLGICLAAVGRLREALTQFKIVLRLDPGNELAGANIRVIEEGLSRGESP
jgi:hypothetical protein